MAKILIVDDDASLREVIRFALESEGYEVIEAEDGEQGVNLACAQLPDLVLCDVRMKKMDGYGALAELRRHSVTAALPFILMTGQADPRGMRQGMELGADDYLNKPFTVDQLIAAVAARLRKAAKVREQAERKLTELRSSISMALPHELLTPLNGILGFADLLVSDAAALKPDEIASMASSIRESADRLHRLIQNFLLLAHLELHQSDQVQLVRGAQLVNLAPWVTGAARERAARYGRDADLELQLIDVHVRTREEYCTKIVQEITDNAFKFSLGGSPVVVSLGVRGKEALLRVTDRGRGLKPEHVAEIGAYMQFERKLHEQQGSGVGLAIARRLTELHGGMLHIASEVGVGTSVEVRLPLPEAA